MSSMKRKRRRFAFVRKARRWVSVSDETFEALKAHYSEAQIVELLGAIALINTWNRLIVGMGF